MKFLIKKILCYLGIHSWVDNGWLRFIQNNGKLQCTVCLKFKK